MVEEINPNLKLFFKKYEEHPCLWDPDDPSYNDAVEKKCAWPKLRDVYRKHVDKFFNTPTNNVTAKYARLFHAEESRIQLHAEQNQPYTPQFPYYEDLIFLKGKREALKRKLQGSGPNDKWDDWAVKMRALPDDKQEKVDIVLKNVYELCVPGQQRQQSFDVVSHPGESLGPSSSGHSETQQPSGIVVNEAGTDDRVSNISDNPAPSSSQDSGTQQPSTGADNANIHRNERHTFDAAGHTISISNAISISTEGGRGNADALVNL